MKHILAIVLFVLAVGYSASGQKTITPVSWEFKLEPINTKDFKLIATASIAPSWVLYSQFMDPDGPIPTSFIVNGSEIQFKEESKVKKEMDKIFEMEVMKFEKKAIFSTVIQKGNSNVVTGSVVFMTCDGFKCLPPATVPFELKF